MPLPRRPSPAQPSRSSCPGCGAPVAARGLPCPKCGAPPGDLPRPRHAMPSRPLPPVSPLALVLAIGSWLIGGILFSIPALVIARGDLRRCREGRSDPGGEGRSLAAAWIAGINIAAFFVICLVLVALAVFSVGSAAAALDPVAWKQRSRNVRDDIWRKTSSQIEADIDKQMKQQSPEEGQLWEQVKRDWTTVREHGKVKGVAWPDSPSMDRLSASVALNARLWTMLAVGEEKVALELGYDKPVRALPFEDTR